MKSKNNKEDFINKISSMSDTELNDFLKKYGKPPKEIPMCIRANTNKIRNELRREENGKCTGAD